MDKTASKPMPCPFCGGQPRIEDYDENPVALSHPDARIVCGNHNCCMENHSFSLSNWNRRSPSEPQASVREQEPVADYHGMEYPLEQLPTVWLALAEELRGYARELEDEPEHAIRFRQRAISIIACAEQLKWSLAHPAQPPAQVDADSAAKEIYTELTDFFGGDDALRHCFTEPEVSSIIRKHIRHTHAPGEGWQWVPKEPTETMIDAGAAVNCPSGWDGLLKEVEARYKAMLAAAPSTQEDEP